MPEPKRIDFGTMSSPGRHGPETGPRHINCYVEPLKEGMTETPIYPCSGLTQFAEVSGGGACRGGIVVNDVLYVISGNKVVTISEVGAVTDIGFISGTDKAIFSRNAAAIPQVGFIVNGTPYVATSSSVSQITDTDLPTPNSITFLDQRNIYGISDGRLFYSDIDNLTSIDALSFATAEGAPDKLVRTYAHRIDLWMFGEETTEIWGSTSSTTNPYQRRGGAITNRGLYGRNTVSSLGDLLFWVGDDRVPQMVSGGYSANPVFHANLCHQIEDAVNPDTIVGFSYYDRGHGFYTLTSPADGWTWQLNVGTGKWFERKSYGYDYWIGCGAWRLGRKTIIGSAIDGKFYEIDNHAYLEGVLPLVFLMRSPPIHAYPNRVSIDRLYANFLTGEGLNSTDPDYANPLVGLRKSDDGGKTWSRQRQATLGVQGARDTRVAFNGLGITGRQGSIFELEVSAAIARGFYGAAIESEVIGT